jgi:hypothetical protein
MSGGQRSDIVWVFKNFSKRALPYYRIQIILVHCRLNLPLIYPHWIQTRDIASHTNHWTKQAKISKVHINHGQKQPMGEFRVLESLFWNKLHIIRPCECMWLAFSFRMRQAYQEPNVRSTNDRISISNASINRPFISFYIFCREYLRFSQVTQFSLECSTGSKDHEIRSSSSSSSSSYTYPTKWGRFNMFFYHVVIKILQLFLRPPAWRQPSLKLKWVPTTATETNG